MGLLPNERHEMFAQGLARGMTTDAAYAAAGFRKHRGNASRLSSNESIMARVAEIQSEAAAEVKIDAAWVLTRAVSLLDKATDAGAYAAAKGTLELIGKHVGVQAFRNQFGVGNPDGTPFDEPDLSGLTMDELIAWKALRSKIRAGMGGGDETAA